MDLRRGARCECQHWFVDADAAPQQLSALGRQWYSAREREREGRVAVMMVMAVAMR